MRFFVVSALASLASLASAVSVDLTRRDTPFEVRLEESGNSGVRGFVTNTGSVPIKVMTVGTILDERPVEKASVYAGDSRVAFDGIRLNMCTHYLTEEAFRVIGAGESIEVDFDAGELHDLSPGGTFDVQTKGVFSTAELDSTVITGALPYASNVLSTKVNGTEAFSVHHVFQERARRSEINNDCTGTRRTATATAIQNCAALAKAAKAAAATDKTRLTKYFKSASASVATTVGNVFSRIEQECASTTSGDSRYHCTDVYGACGNGVIAYTLPSRSLMVNCRTFFDRMPVATRRCHGQDQQTTVLHEMTHLSEVAGTEDYGGYGFAFVQSLSARQNLNHADTYTLFAQSIFAKC
ncbi:metallo proteinase [Plectosphaerella plurivora]|uniref:Neutral protease 2 n=1 Tax=Plectosphaerella plurivora TaxID=936078 RepID=A0A9P8V786_9PEZI|nr:metallo proteinase [Plectosphaerella plurivora]